MRDKDGIRNGRWEDGRMRRGTNEISSYFFSWVGCGVNGGEGRIIYRQALRYYMLDRYR